MKKLRNHILIIFLVSMGYLLLTKFAEPFVLRYFSYKEVYAAIVLAFYGWTAGGYSLRLLKKEGRSLSIYKTSFKALSGALALALLLTALTIFFGCFFGKASLYHYQSIANSGIYALFASPTLNMIFHASIVLIVAILTSLTVNFLFILGEELFLRGYLYEQLICLGFFKASLFIGLISGLWKAPLFLLFAVNFPDYPVLNSLIIFALYVLIAPLCVYLRVEGKSLALPTFFHAMVSTYAPIASVFFPGANPFFVGSMGLAGLLGLVTMNVMLIPRYRALTYSRLENARLSKKLI